MKEHLFKTASMLLLAGLIFAVSGEEMEAADGVLQIEDRGDSVVELQKKLIKMGYLHTEATGYYGELTKQAVKDFQQDFGLAVDGVSGVNTLFELDNVEEVARAVHGEARGESFEGQVAVAAVIRNRLQSPEFPSTISEVINQTNAFTAVRDGQYYLEPNSSAFKAVKEAWGGKDPSAGSHYYYNPALATSEWIFTREVSHRIGNHVFAN